jgi:hypothetical protein
VSIADAPVHLSQDVQAAFAAVLRLLRRGPGAATGGAPVPLRVDGAAITVAPWQRGVRMACALPRPDRGEVVLRDLMRRALRQVDADAPVLCADSAGDLHLVSVIPEGEAVQRRAARFCDAAVHWTRHLRPSTPDEVPSMRQSDFVPTFIRP